MIERPTVERNLRPLMGRGVLHFMGVGGAGMCALAEAVVRGGGRVSGCDANPGPSVHTLERLGVQILTGHDPGHLKGVAALVISAALSAEHPEVRAAQAQGIPVIKRAEALGGWVAAGRVAAVAGTHGKTTTTALLTHILAEAGQDPTGFVGGEVLGWQSHLRPGSDALFVVEADEYDRSFHHLHPWVTVVTNMEADHLDLYGSLEGVRSSFKHYLKGVQRDGVVWLCADDPGSLSLLPETEGRGRTYGLSEHALLRAVDVHPRGGGTDFRVVEAGERRGEISLPLPGLHNVANALGAAGAAHSLGVDWAAICAAIATFGGVRRRFQRLGEVGGVRVVDDYAHHPTEVDATLAAARQAFPEARLVAVFQPHLFSRTQSFHREFGVSLAQADEVWIAEVYPAREAPLPGVDGPLVATSVVQAAASHGNPGMPVHFHPDLDRLPEAVAEALHPGDVCLTLGAGSIERVGPAILDCLRTRLERGSADA
jgi:UDP-N-acetylmuramate--alanine ligase